MAVYTQARAYPRKSFFLEMFTRDISLEDPLLDMIDNAIDGLARNYDPEMFKQIGALTGQNEGAKHRIDVAYSKKRIAISDNCGGIPFEIARDDVFNFGHSLTFEPPVSKQLGIYGVGLKRAAFKMGRRIRIVSRAQTDGFYLDWDVDKWSKKDDRLEDWTVPIRKAGGTRATKSRGTKIVVERLRPEVISVLETPEFDGRLRQRIATTYTWFLGTKVTVTLNGRNVDPFKIPLASSQGLRPAMEMASLDSVDATLWAGVTERGLKGREERNAGWYVMCNGRVVVAADKSDLTGWGEGAMPQWHDKYRGFVGLAFFTSDDALALPWTTTKRGLHRESAAYMTCLNRMRAIARPVLQFLNQQYGQDPEPSAIARELAKEARATDFRAVPRESIRFTPILPPKQKKKNTVTVHLTIALSKIVTAKRLLENPELEARDVVLGALDAFIELKGS
jgi:hypothetical protein